MDLKAQLAGKLCKLSQVETKFDLSFPATSLTSLIDEWAEEQKFKLKEEILFAREKFFDTSLDLVRKITPKRKKLKKIFLSFIFAEYFSFFFSLDFVRLKILQFLSYFVPKSYSDIYFFFLKVI